MGPNPNLFSSKTITVNELGKAKNNVAVGFRLMLYRIENRNRFVLGNSLHSRRLINGPACARALRHNFRGSIVVCETHLMQEHNTRKFCTNAVNMFLMTLIIDCQSFLIVKNVAIEE